MWGLTGMRFLYSGDSRMLGLNNQCPGSAVNAPGPGHRRKPVTSSQPTRVVAYCRASTRHQTEDGVSLDAQHLAITDAAARRGWTIVATVDEQVSGGAKDKPKRETAIGLIEAGGADALVVTKLDRVPRSIQDFGALIERAKGAEWSLIVLEPDLDMTTPGGEMIANVLMSFAQYERGIIGQRTKEALVIKRRDGVRLGRPSRLSDQVRDRIRQLRSAGLSYPAIATRLNADCVPSATGGRWYPSTVRGAIVTGAAA